jgi:hypothetical protein
MITRRPLFATALTVAALTATILAIPGQATAERTPGDGRADTSASVHIPASGGRTDEQFWGEATWLNPLSGLNLDRSSVGH